MPLGVGGSDHTSWMAVELMAVALKLSGGLSGTVKCMVFVNANDGI